eukprot:UN31796
MMGEMMPPHVSDIMSPMAVMQGGLPHLGQQASEGLSSMPSMLFQHGFAPQYPSTADHQALLQRKLQIQQHLYLNQNNPNNLSNSMYQNSIPGLANVPGVAEMGPPETSLGEERVSNTENQEVKSNTNGGDSSGGGNSEGEAIPNSQGLGTLIGHPGGLMYSSNYHFMRPPLNYPQVGAQHMYSYPFGAYAAMGLGGPTMEPPTTNKNQTVKDQWN